LKPFRHSRSSVKEWGGRIEDYLPLHEKMDCSKIVHATMKHRVIFHSAFGIYLLADIFGNTIVNADNIEVSVRDIAERHVLEDLGTIPSLDKWLSEMTIKEWMGGPIRKIRNVSLID
jgi:uncharacterized protein DUF6915